MSTTSELAAVLDAYPARLPATSSAPLDCELPIWQVLADLLYLGACTARPAVQDALSGLVTRYLAEWQAEDIPVGPTRPTVRVGCLLLDLYRLAALPLPAELAVWRQEVAA